MITPPFAYEVTVAGTVYRCQGAEICRPASGLYVRSEMWLKLIGVSRIGTQNVHGGDIDFPVLIDHTIRPVREDE